MNRDKSKLPLPALLLFLGCALSCSTACITSAIIDKAADQSHAMALADAEALLERNRVAQSGTTALPVITTEPESIALALRPALPLRRAEGKEPYFAQVVVVKKPSANNPEWTRFEIAAYGDFTPAYATAFGNFARKLSQQFSYRIMFSVSTYTGTPDARIVVDPL